MSARSIDEVIADHTDRLMAIPGVVGVAQGALEDGTPTIMVMVAVPPAIPFPDVLEGHPLRVHVSGEFEARPSDD